MSDPRSAFERGAIHLTPAERDLADWVNVDVIGMLQEFSSYGAEFIEDSATVSVYLEYFIEAQQHFKELLHNTEEKLPALEAYPKPEFRSLAVATRHCFNRYKAMLPHIEIIGTLMEQAAAGQPFSQPELLTAFGRYRELEHQTRPFMQNISDNPVFKAAQKPL